MNHLRRHSPISDMSILQLDNWHIRSTKGAAHSEQIFNYDTDVCKMPRGGGVGGGGTWVFRGAHTLVIKIKKYP